MIMPNTIDMKKPTQAPATASEQHVPRPVQLVKISAVGTAVPPGLLTNKDLTKIVDTTDEWIRTRTGIVQRHVVAKGVASSDLGAEAAKQALSRAGVAPTDIELIIVATITPDMIFPSTACLVQHKIGAKGAWGFDLNAACSGFLYALQTGVQFIASGVHKKVLVIGADIMTSITDYQDRNTCVLFGDAAGAVLLEGSSSADDGCFIDFLHEVDGSGGHLLQLPAGGSLNPASHETVEKRMHYLRQDGPTVFKFATLKMSEICNRLLARNGLTGADVDVFIPHQANKRIIDAAAQRIGAAPDRVIINIDQFGNTTAATVPMAMNTALEQGKLKKGDLVLIGTMGAGLTSGAALLRWG